MKVRIFAGREHHAQKLNNLYVALHEKKHDVRWLITRNAINIDPSTEFIHRHGEYHHIHDWLSPSAVEEINNTSASLQDWSVDGRLNRHIAPFWISHSIREAAENLVLFREYLDEEKPDAIVALHANNYHSKPLLYLAQERGKGMPTFAYQEGILRHRDQDTMNKQASAAEYVDAMFTWSQEDRAVYEEAGVPEGVVRPVGPIHLDGWIHLMGHPQQRREFVARFHLMNGVSKAAVLSFMPPQLNRYEGNFDRAVNALASFCRDSGMQLIIKPHPFNYNAIDSMRESLEPFDVIVYGDTDPMPLIASSDVVLGQHTTIGLEALYLGIPYAQVDFDNVGLEERVVEGITTINDKNIGDILQLEAPQLESINPLADGRATERAVCIVEGMI